MHFFFYYIILIIQSYLKLSLWRWTSGQPTSPEVCQQLHFLSQTSLSLPPATWEAKVEHEHWDIRQEREGKTGWLTGEVSPEGRLSALPEKKMTDSECLYCWQTWAPRGGWGERARMAKDVPEWGQQTRSSKLCHHQNYEGAKRLLSLLLHFWTLTLDTHKCLVHLKSMWTIWNSEKRKYRSSCMEVIGPVYEWFDVQWIYKGSLQKMSRGLGVLTPPDKLLIK